ncbi:hypothetical protein [Nocardia sp. NPDC048505]|uniref:hypothetical protein n=1 Tax=unclassified Nocardia TaxID=2637762 RepID=UPI003400B1B4
MTETLAGRVTQLENRVGDVEHGYNEEFYQLGRRVTGVEVHTARIATQTTAIAQGIGLMMERMGLQPIHIPPAAAPTDDEVDAALEENC